MNLLDIISYHIISYHIISYHVGKAVCGALRGHPKLQQATLKQLRKHLETALAQDLTEWKDEIKRATQAFMQAQAQAQA